MEKWLEEKYNKTFSDVKSNIELKRKNDPEFGAEELEELLRVQYLYMDQDWCGRGEVADVPIQATIAAYETCLAEWKDEEDNE